LQQHFMSPSETPIGVRAGLAVLLRHLDVTQVLFGGSSAGGFVDAAYRPDRSVVPGAVLLVVWLVAVAVSWRLRHRALMWLHTCIGAVLVLEAASMVRIFGKVWYYLTLWAWAVTVALVDQGYPDAVQGGGVLGGLSALDPAQVTVFHAGTRLEDGEWRVRGGRAAYLMATGPTIESARASVERARMALSGTGWRCREDIALQIPHVMRNA